MSVVLVVAPHPDDETLGCGGTLLRHHEEGASLHWLVATRMGDGFSDQRRNTREDEIERIRRHYGFTSVTVLPHETGSLDHVSRGDLVAAIGSVVRQQAPDTLYLPFRGDAHSDHAHCFDAAAACTKWFRYPSVRRVRVYETLSETGFGLGSECFRPNLWVGLEQRHLDHKLAAMAVYDGELGTHPFPRSVQAISAQALLRGGECGHPVAEAFQSLREIV